MCGRDATAALVLSLFLIFNRLSQRLEVSLNIFLCKSSYMSLDLVLYQLLIASPLLLHFQSKAYWDEVNQFPVTHWLKHGGWTEASNSARVFPQSSFYSTQPQPSWIPGNLKSPTPTRFFFKESGIEGFLKKINKLPDNFSGVLKDPDQMLDISPHLGLMRSELVSPLLVCSTKSEGLFMIDLLPHQVLP